MVLSLDVTCTPERGVASSMGDVVVFRDLSHFMRASERGAATDPVAYLSAAEDQDLGVLKRKKRQAQEPDKPDENRGDLALDTL